MSARRRLDLNIPAIATAPLLKEADTESQGRGSPVLEMRERLEAALRDVCDDGASTAPPNRRRWSARRSAALIILTSGSLWAGILIGLKMVI